MLSSHNISNLILYIIIKLNFIIGQLHKHLVGVESYKVSFELELIGIIIILNWNLVPCFFPQWI